MQRLFFLGVVAMLLTTVTGPAQADSKRDQHAKDSAVQYLGMNAPSGATTAFGTGDTSYKGTLSDSGQVIRGPIGRRLRYRQREP